MDNCAKNLDRPCAEEKLTTFGSRLSELISFLKITKKAFAQENGVVPQTVTNYCADVHEPKQKFVDLVIEKYNVNPEWLKKGAGSMFGSKPNEENSAGETAPQNYEHECIRLKHALADQTLETARIRDEKGQLQGKVFAAVELTCQELGLTPNQVRALQYAVMNYEGVLNGQGVTSNYVDPETDLSHRKAAGE